MAVPTQIVDNKLLSNDVLEFSFWHFEKHFGKENFPLFFFWVESSNWSQLARSQWLFWQRVIVFQFLWMIFQTKNAQLGWLCQTFSIDYLGTHGLKHFGAEKQVFSPIPSDYVFGICQVPFFQRMEKLSSSMKTGCVCWGEAHFFWISGLLKHNPEKSFFSKGLPISIFTLEVCS